MPVLDDPDTSVRARDVRRLVLCTGKVYVDLISSPRRAEAKDVAIARLEQLYPYPENELKALFASYPRLREVVWLQEEPQNMGYWEFLMPLLRETHRQEGLADLRGPSAQREPVGRLVGVARDQSAAAGRGRVRRNHRRAAADRSVGPGAPAKSPAPRETVKR